VKDVRAIPFDGVARPIDALRQLVRVRFAECLEKQNALLGNDDDAIHRFRLACKRLRFAIERESASEGDLASAAELLSRITDQLGCAHDCVVLARRARDCGAQAAVHLSVRDRARCIRAARDLWQRGFKSGAPFEGLVTFTGFQWTM
jgi:CHAD domain-containing protein